ncbi:putative alpha,alpha-trehalose-phosphate synthase [UDP-forming] 9 [Gossypium australe]|uniref:Putative alpha,alpha-trehalose-phosphate synthase [UDP-forming] 9 n=1 Tax=Gossypium australe TaxID=47621 RepID=A0A5B6WZM0_9ROSI|nr:putative alpha,alpha-trehalose-phosphate synthase [UDP-forming] 9 [Gossypium australe]
MGWSDDDKLGCDVSLLTDEAHRCWLTIESGTVSDRLTWDFFLSLFRRKFMGEQYLGAKRWEFMNLVQGTLSLDEYEAEFVWLSQYALKLVAHESIEVFDEFIEKARTLEETSGEEPKVVSFGNVKRTIDAASGSGCKGKRGRFDRSDQRVAGGRGQDR